MIAKMIIDEKLLVEFLHLPEATRIVGAELEWRNGNCTAVIIRVSHPDIVSDEVQPVYETRHYVHDEVHFVSWNWEAPASSSSSKEMVD